MMRSDSERKRLHHFDEIKILISFVVLFSLYHAAEYQIVTRGSVVGFLLVQALFWIIAFLLGQNYRRNGLTSWGLPFSWKLFKSLFAGIVLGIALYATAFIISEKSGVERIVEVPDLAEILKQSLPFSFGVLLSSFSEDVLTRGVVYAYLGKKTNGMVIVLISAVIYTLNHIYRLADGPDTLLYLFLLGTIFMVAMVNTKNLWFTGAMHWAGNAFFYITHNVINTVPADGIIPPNYLFAAVIVIFIPVIWLVTRKIDFTIEEKRKSY